MTIPAWIREPLYKHPYYFTGFVLSAAAWYPILIVIYVGLNTISENMHWIPSGTPLLIINNGLGLVGYLLLVFTMWLVLEVFYGLGKGVWRIYRIYRGG